MTEGTADAMEFQWVETIQTGIQMPIGGTLRYYENGVLPWDFMPIALVQLMSSDARSGYA
jgi:hypothetical protein